MVPQVILKDAGLILRPYEAMDVDSHYHAALESIDQVYPWLPWCKPGYLREHSELWIETRNRDWVQGVSYDFVITDAITGALLGSTAINHIDHENNFANLGYWVRTARTRHGIATAAARMTVRFGFEIVGLNRIEIVVAAGNAPSQRVAEKIGALKEGMLRNRVVIARGASDAVLYSLVPDDVRKWPRK